MKRSVFLLAGLVSAALLSSCAEVSGALPMAMNVLGSRISVSVPAEVPFPDTLVLKMDPNTASVAAMGNGLLAALGQDSLQDKLGKVIKDQTQSLRADAADAFKQQVIASKLFGQVLNSGGNAGLSIGVSRYGVSWSPATQSYQLVLDLVATVTEPHVGTVWTGTRAMKDLGADVKDLASHVDVAKLVTSPQGFKDLTQAGIKDLSAQLLDDLKKNPPLSGIGAKQ